MATFTSPGRSCATTTKSDPEKATPQPTQPAVSFLDAEISRTEGVIWTVSALFTILTVYTLIPFIYPEFATYWFPSFLAFATTAYPINYIKCHNNNTSHTTASSGFPSSSSSISSSSPSFLYKQVPNIEVPAYSPAQICPLYTATTQSSQSTFLKTILDVAFQGNFSVYTHPINMGILSPGSYKGEYVDLSPFFTGEYKSANVGGYPASINFLDSKKGKGKFAPTGGHGRFYERIRQGRMRSGMEAYLGRVMGCSVFVGETYDWNKIEAAHRFMGISEAEAGYFVKQVELAMVFVGVDKVHARDVADNLKERFERDGGYCTSQDALQSEKADRCRRPERVAVMKRQLRPQR
ncbi:hypothetical protein H072_1925 [Dactylellina haptotyla CBS 200.50]|uniref:Uncharacterized protein n=1 Tax=Dactylellina haptotyla (strain CBS 200.50) TaxID=1284197 RepID=S8ASS0_DACHA|nr:hypothetical protein H072_1925 [Dactylellina haptotyla CBS 200.50]